MRSALAGFCLVLAACDHSDHDQPLTREAYVWQNPARAEVFDAVESVSSSFDSLHFRAAEFRWNGRDFEIDQVVTNALPAPNCGLVLRIGQSAAGLEWTEEQIAPVTSRIAALARLGPREIQCDYDCPQSRLATYRRLLQRLRMAAGEVPIIPTTLPSWLAEPEFAALARESPGYVLQVHSLSLPATPEDDVVLLDPALARSAVDRAAAIGTPFRVALPTYGCEVWFGGSGKVIEVVSEDSPRDRLAPTRVSFAYADPAVAAHLISGWEKTRPPHLTGIVWYRLPVAGDRRNWPWPTLSKVIHGETPASDLQIECLPAGGDVSLANHGDAPARLPSSLTARGPVAAADAVGAYRLESGGAETVFRHTAAGWPWIDPGESLTIGWITTNDSGTSLTWEIE